MGILLDFISFLYTIENKIIIFGICPPPHFQILNKALLMPVVKTNIMNEYYLFDLYNINK